MSYLNYLFLCLILNVCLFAIISCEECGPDNEFEDPTVSNQTITKWNNYIENLLNFTTTTNVSKLCENNSSNLVVIDKNSDSLWEIRFMLYSEVQPKFDSCYAEQNNTESCNITQFQSCMLQARSTMYSHLENYSWWNKIVQKKLNELAANC